MSEPTLIAALERCADDLAHFVAIVKANAAQGIDLLARACAPRPPKDGIDRTLLGLLPDEIVERLNARNADPAPPRSDPTVGAALNAESEGRRRLMLDYARATITNANNLMAFVEGGQPKPVSPAKREAVARANALHCESCARTKTAGGRQRETDPVGGPRDLNGRLARKMLLCQQCADRAIWRHDNGYSPTLPPQAEVDAFRSAGAWPKVPHGARLTATAGGA